MFNLSMWIHKALRITWSMTMKRIQIFEEMFCSCRCVAVMVCLFVLLATSWPLMCRAQETGGAFTIRSSIDHALKHSTLVLSSKEGVAAAEANKKKHVSEFLPKLSASYAYTRLDEEKTWLSVVTRPQELYNFTATVDQPLFSGFSRLTQYQISALGLDIERIRVQQTRLDLILQIKTAYFRLLQTEKLEKVAQQAVAQLAANAAVTGNFYEVGMVARNNVLEAEVALANVKQGLVVATNNVELAKSRFNTLLRRPVDAPLAVEDILTYQPFARSYEDCVQTALEKRPEIRVADLQVKTAEGGVRLTRKDYYPSLNLKATYYAYGDSPGLNGGEGITDESEWDVVATASWTLWEWGKTRHEVKEKLGRLSQARLGRAALEDSVRHDVKGAYLTVQAAESAILTVQKAVEQAQENFRMNEERFKEQVATSTDVLDAQTLLTETQTKYFNALSAFNISQAALERAMGVQVPQ